MKLFLLLSIFILTQSFAAVKTRHDLKVAGPLSLSNGTGRLQTGDATITLNQYDLTTSTSGLNIVGTGTLLKASTINIDTASSTQQGLLSAVDWSTFNDKSASVHATRHYNANADPVNAQAFHGFVNRTDSTISFNNSNRTLTLSGTFVYYFQGNKITVSSSPNVQIDNTNGLWFIYFNSAGTLTANQNFPAFDTTVIAATVFWNGTMGLINDERHGYIRNLAWHEWAHDTIGTRYGSGLDLTTNGVGAAATFTLTTGTIFDEDLEFSTNVAATQTARFYQTGATTYTATASLTSIPFFWNPTTSRVQYVNAAAPYALADVTNTRFINSWVYATTGLSTPVYMIAETLSSATGGYTTAANARAVSPPALTNSGLQPELKLLYRLVIKGDGTIQTPVAADDYRNSQPLPSGGTAATNASAVSFAPYGDISSVTVQSAIQELDDEKLKINSTLLPVPSALDIGKTLIVTSTDTATWQTAAGGTSATSTYLSYVGARQSFNASTTTTVGINTFVGNTLSITLAANVFTLPAGRWLIEWWQPMAGNSGSALITTALTEDSGSTAVAGGTSVSSTGGSVSVISQGAYFVTLAAPKAYRIDSYEQAGQSGYLGRTTSGTETGLLVRLTKY
jgi:hypothetical protein